jgi:hypothetical protein
MSDDFEGYDEPEAGYGDDALAGPGGLGPGRGGCRHS